LLKNTAKNTNKIAVWLGIILFFFHSCNMHLNQWDSMVEYSMEKGLVNTQLLMESSWRVATPNWGQMKEALTQVGFVFNSIAYSQNTLNIEISSVFVCMRGAAFASE